MTLRDERRDRQRQHDDRDGCMDVGARQHEHHHRVFGGSEDQR
jgi:hypothetical protein